MHTSELFHPNSDPNTRQIDECQGRETASVGLEIFSYEVIDSRELARRLSLPVSWVRDNVRSRTIDPIPHSRFGRYVRFGWGSPELEAWLRRRMMKAPNHKRLPIQ